jgi:hypothetical protein
MSFKSLVIFTKASHFETKASISLKMYLKSLKSFKMSHINQKNPNLSGNSLENLEFFKKASHHFKKASILLKMSSKSLVIFEKASDFLLKPPFL